MKSFKKISLFTALFALLLSFSFATSNAQVTPDTTALTLKGEVVDAQTNKVLTDAEITIKGKDISATTDTEGKFKLENLSAGNHTVVVEAEGYQTWEKALTLDADKKLTIKLKPNTTE